jgi:hypothetical protein
VDCKGACQRYVPESIPNWPVNHFDCRQLNSSLPLAGLLHGLRRLPLSKFNSPTFDFVYKFMDSMQSGITPFSTFRFFSWPFVHEYPPHRSRRGACLNSHGVCGSLYRAGGHCPTFFPPSLAVPCCGGLRVEQYAPPHNTMYGHLFAIHFDRWRLSASGLPQTLPKPLSVRHSPLSPGNAVVVGKRTRVVAEVPILLE